MNARRASRPFQATPIDISESGEMPVIGSKSSSRRPKASLSSMARPTTSTRTKSPLSRSEVQQRLLEVGPPAQRQRSEGGALYLSGTRTAGVEPTHGPWQRTARGVGPRRTPSCLPAAAPARAHSSGCLGADSDASSGTLRVCTSTHSTPSVGKFASTGIETASVLDLDEVSQERGLNDWAGAAQACDSSSAFGPTPRHREQDVKRCS